MDFVFLVGAAVMLAAVVGMALGCDTLAGRP